MTIVPREHGFWVILGAVVLSALSRSTGSPAAWIAACVVVIAATAVASLLGRNVRRSERLQLALAGALPVAGVPIRLAAGSSLASAAADACAWAVVFTASALSVRATFARASRSRHASATRLARGSVAVPMAAAFLFFLASLQTHAVVALVAAAGLAVLALWAPGAKQIRAVGLSLAAIALIAAIVFGVA
jgi:hypothetical protein